MSADRIGGGDPDHGRDYYFFMPYDISPVRIPCPPAGGWDPSHGRDFSVDYTVSQKSGYRKTFRQWSSQYIPFPEIGEILAMAEICLLMIPPSDISRLV